MRGRVHELVEAYLSSPIHHPPAHSSTHRPTHAYPSTPKKEPSYENSLRD